MKVTHELCLGHESSATDARMAEILAALGHAPGFKLMADTPTDTVHGRVTVAFCDTRTIGEEIQWHDGQWREITEKNVAEYFAGQAAGFDANGNKVSHRLVKIEGDKAYGNTIISIQVTEADEAPTKARKTTLARPSVFPSAEDLKARLDTVEQSTAIVVP